MKKNFMKLTSCLLAMAMATASVLAPGNVYTSTTSKAATSLKRVSVHDPSVAVSKDGTYYVFGSHADAAKSTDLQNWTTFSNGIRSVTNNKLYGNMSSNLSKAFKWAGENDVDSKNGHSVWAPDVFWNPDYVNKNGTKGAYMIYFCTTSTAIRSVLAYGVSQNIEGPYEFVDTLIYSGFTKTSKKDSGSSIDKIYTNTNIDELMNAGTIEKGLNDDWFTPMGEFNNSYAPNAIDPTVFYDKDGKLWMTYGSWSGGIFVLQLDPATGKAIYPGKNSTKNGLVVDKYFGTRIAGGYRKSGEGPYILYDKTSDYYYLYVSYEGLAQTQGYNMRLFRSKNPDGPYVDASGKSAVISSSSVNHNNIGIKVMGNYTLPYLAGGYMAPGHNSAFIDDKDGQRYLLYHTRFEKYGEMHQVRVHQQFLNEAGWPVTAVYENNGDKISETGYSKDQIVGEYSFVNHGTNNDGSNVKETQTLVLNSNGTVSGDVSGTWTAKDNTYYMSIKIGNVVYSGVFFLQTAEMTTKKVMTFTAVGTNNQTIWGVQNDISLSAAQSTLYVCGNTGKTTQMKLSGVAGKSYTVTYKSSKPSVATVNSKGKVTAKKKGSTKITATVRINGTAKNITKTIKVKKAYLKFSKKKATLKKGKSYTYKVKAYGIKKSSVTFKSSKSSVLSIKKKSGKAKAKKKGSATITAKYKKITVKTKVKVK